jgi:hypothetical protein
MVRMVFIMVEREYLIHNKRQHKSLFSQIQGENSAQLIEIIRKQHIENINIISSMKCDYEEEDTYSYYFYLSIESDKKKLLKIIIKNCKVSLPMDHDTELKNLNLRNYTKDCAKYVKAEIERYFIRDNISLVKINLKENFEPDLTTENKEITMKLRELHKKNPSKFYELKGILNVMVALQSGRDIEDVLNDKQDD